MTSARARKAQRQPTSNPPKGEGLRRKPSGPAHLAGPFFALKFNRAASGSNFRRC